VNPNLHLKINRRYPTFILEKQRHLILVIFILRNI